MGAVSAFGLGVRSGKSLFRLGGRSVVVVWDRHHLAGRNNHNYQSISAIHFWRSAMFSEQDLFERFDIHGADEIMMYLAFCAMRVGGHRYGAFLDAATTAAKCAVYVTYQEQQQNIRMTGHLHHIEPKRVKAIVQEIEAALEEGKLAFLLSSHEPAYLIQLPHVWQELFPWSPGQPRLKAPYLNGEERYTLEKKLTGDLLPVQVIGALEFSDLLVFLHQRSQAHLPPDRQVPLSEALAEHIKRRLFYAGTVERLDNPWGLPFYWLRHPHYSPAGTRERQTTMLEETANYFRLMRCWSQEEPQVYRILEQLDLHPDRWQAAKEELNQFFQQWANRYHERGQPTAVVQMIFGVPPEGV